MLAIAGLAHSLSSDISWRALYVSKDKVYYAGAVNRTMTSWIEIPADSDFSVRNLPYGIFSTAHVSPRIGTAIGAYVLDLNALAQDGVFSSVPFDASTLERSTLNEYASLDKSVHLAVRQLLLELLKQDTSLGPALRDNEERKQRVLLPLGDVEMHLPMHIGDYTDFCASVYHARNASILPALPLPGCC